MGTQGDGNSSAGLEAALRPAAMEGETHLPPQTSPIGDSKGLVIAVNCYRRRHRLHARLASEGFGLRTVSSSCLALPFDGCDRTREMA